MTSIREEILRRNLGRLEMAIGQQAEEQDIQAARKLSTGSKILVARPERQLLIAALAAIAADEPLVHLVATRPEDAAAISVPIAEAGLTHITCATVEELVFAFLKGDSNQEAFAIVADAEQVLIRDAQVPVIITEPTTSIDSVGGNDYRADYLQNGRDYVVQNGSIVIRDPQGGALLPGRRFSHGVHAVLQAREGLPVELVGDVVAQITIGDYFHGYKSLAALASEPNSVYQSVYGLA